MLDIVLGHRGDPRCDGVSRRDFLRVGALGGLSLTLPGLLRGQAQAATKHRARAKSVLLVYLGGGLSHHDSFDPKPDAPAEVRGKYKPIDTCVPGLRITDMLPRMAKVMDRLTLVRSGAHNNDHHETATNWVLCGRFGSAFGDYPAMGAVVAHEMGFSGKLPPYVAIPRNPSFTWELGKSAFLGGRYESFKTGDPNAADFKVQDVSPFETLTAKRRPATSDALGSRGWSGQADRGQRSDHHLRRVPAASRDDDPVEYGARRFAIEKESDKLRDRYGRNTFGQSCLLARRLVEGSVRFITVNNGGWDHHAKIWDGLGHRLPEFDQGFSALLEDLHTRGLLADTLVLVMGEFGRTPKINKDVGRDHWGPAASLLFAGAGVRGGQVLGQTDKQGAYVTRRPVPPADVACTVFEALGIDPRKSLLAPDGRPIEILDKGENVKELY